MREHTKMQSLTFTQETQFNQSIENDIKTFWANREEKYLTGINEVSLYTVALTSASHQKAIVVVNGRTESSLKYQELFYDLFRQGYDIYAFDHRGQGLSGRIAHDPHMGHVEDFNDYIADMQTVLAQFPLSKYTNTYLLGHSMGGAITARYLQTHPGSGFSAVALSSPMFGIYMPPLLKPIAAPISKVIANLSNKPNYALGQTGYSKTAFEENVLTHSKIRYDWSTGLNQDIEQIRLGGPTNKWVVQALDAAQLCVDRASEISIPLLLLQSEEDTVVSNTAQNQFMTNIETQNSASKKVQLKGSYHEPLLETDAIRNQALSEIIHWFQNHENERTQTKN